MDKITEESLSKIMIDAKKIGVCDSRTELLVRDFLKNIEKEIKSKEETIMRTAGELISLRKMSTMWSGLIRNHVNMEKSNIENMERQQRMMENANSQDNKETVKEETLSEEEESISNAIEEIKKPTKKSSKKVVKKNDQRNK